MEGEVAPIRRNILSILLACTSASINNRHTSKKCNFISLECSLSYTRHIHNRLPLYISVPSGLLKVVKKETCEELKCGMVVEYLMENCNLVNEQHYVMLAICDVAIYIILNTFLMNLTRM